MANSGPNMAILALDGSGSCQIRVSLVNHPDHIDIVPARKDSQVMALQVVLDDLVDQALIEHAIPSEERKFKLNHARVRKWRVVFQTKGLLVSFLQQNSQGAQLAETPKSNSQRHFAYVALQAVQLDDGSPLHGPRSMIPMHACGSPTCSLVI